MKRAGTLALMIGFFGAASVVATAAPANAASNPVAIWEMNEPGGATVMTDTSVHHLNGQIGNKVTTGYATQGVVGYKYPFVDNRSPYDPGHVVTVPNNALLNPGTGTFSVTVSFQSTVPGRNIIQKGQATTSGGFFKMEIASGVVDCVFRGSSGTVSAGSGSAPVLDRNFHTITCTRTATQVQMTVDGKVTSTHSGATGNIANSSLLSIGGKTACNGTTVECDPFVGTINRAEIDRPS